MISKRIQLRNCSILVFHATSGWGGAEKTALNIVKALFELPACVKILTNECLFVSENVPSSIIRVEPFRAWFENWTSIYKDFVRFVMILRHIRPKVVIAMMPYAAFLASMARRLTHYPFIHVASPRGSCLSYLKHFVRSRKDKIRYRIFF